MIKPIVTNEKVIFGPVRLSYVHLLEKWAADSNPDNAKYQTGILIPKTEKETIAAINTAIESAKKKAISDKWDGKEPKKMDSPLRDGDDKDGNAEEYENMYYITAKSTTRPQVIGRNNEPLTDEDDVYSGMWALVSVTFYGYSVSGNKGIAAAINNVKKVKDGERFGGSNVSAESEFGDIQLDDEDDDDL